MKLLTHRPSRRAATKRRSFLASLAAGSALLSGIPFGCAPSRKRLHVYIYPDYIDPKAVAAFEKEHDCDVIFDYFEDPGVMLSKMAAGGASVYDVLVPSHFTLPGLIKQNLVAPIRRENVPNFRHVDPQFLDQAFDPGNAHSVPYLWGTTGIYARKTEGDSLPRSWGLLFDPSIRRKPFTLLEDHRFCVGAALHFLGFKMNTVAPHELARVRELLTRTKSEAFGFSTGLAARSQILAKTTEVAMVYNTDGMIGERQDPATEYFVPREGGGLWLDALAVPARAPHRDLAETFIDFLLEPRVNAGIAEVTRTATANRSALEYVPVSEKQNPGVYPPPDVFKRLEYALDLGADNRLYDELWTQIKAA